jgi:hypothetical protein
MNQQIWGANPQQLRTPRIFQKARRMTGSLLDSSFMTRK